VKTSAFIEYNLIREPNCSNKQIIYTREQPLALLNYVFRTSFISKLQYN